MTSPHTLRLLALASLAGLTALPAAAQDSPFYYLGLGAGQSRVNIDEGRIANRLLGEGLATSVITHDQRSTAYKVFGGYQFNRYFALEAGYFKLGNFGFKASTTPAGTLDGRFHVQGVNADAVLLMPLTDQLSALGRLGVQYARSRDDFSATGAASTSASNSPSRRATNAKVGLGLQYAVNNSFTVRAEGERYRINDALGQRGDVNVMSISLLFPFGRSPTTSPRVSAAPVAYEPVAAAPVVAPAAPPVMAAAPVPVVVAPLPPPLRQKVSFSAESMFGFDASAVQASGKTALDTFAGELVGTQFESINVTGHTDRLGTTAYNQTLSQQRADAVKTYLVGTGKVDASKVNAVGKGETMPVTATADCKGKQVSAKLISCLQPDRRVDVEVIGSR